MEKKNTFFFAPDEVKLKREYHDIQSLPYVVPHSLSATPIKVDYKITAKPYKKPFVYRFYKWLKVICLILIILNVCLYWQLVLKLW